MERVRGGENKLIEHANLLKSNCLLTIDPCQGYTKSNKRLLQIVVRSRLLKIKRERETTIQNNRTFGPLVLFAINTPSVCVCECSIVRRWKYYNNGCVAFIKLCILLRIWHRCMHAVSYSEPPPTHRVNSNHPQIYGMRITGFVIFHSVLFIFVANLIVFMNL